MFSSPLGRSRRNSATAEKEISCPWRDTSTIEDPVEEFNYLLDRLNCLIEISNDTYQESIKITPNNNNEGGGGGPPRLAGLFRRRNYKKPKEATPNKKEEDNNNNKEQEQESKTTKDKESSSKEEEEKEQENAEEKVEETTETTAGNQEETAATAAVEAAAETSTENDNDNEKSETEPLDSDKETPQGECESEDAANHKTEEGNPKDDSEAAGDNNDNDDDKEETHNDTPINADTSTPSSSQAAAAAPATPDRPISSNAAASPHTPPPSMSKANHKKGDAYFMHMAEEDECVEILRRIAELVVIGERIVSTQINNEEKKKKHQQKKGWGDDITEDEDLTLSGPGERELDPDSEQYLPIFDNFFERNGLGFLVDILTGAVFNHNHQNDTDNPNSGEGATEAAEEKDSHAESESDTEGRLPKGRWRFLPPLKVATQAVQSVSILVQNVSRATSLYFVLSNNHINELIGLPLDLYSLAERNRLEAEGNPPQVAGKHFTTQELQELTTHFVTFLKSLAMRMNTETLQFFLKYPLHSEHSEESTEETRAKAIEFPLYARALDFCAPHHDSFVRVTSLNICLNTLRLTTVAPKTHDEDEVDDADDDAGAAGERIGSSPDGVLHNANPLPFREALAIATHACAPSRLSRLASPIFTKLAQLWGQLEEKFLDLDTPLGHEDLFPGKSKLPIDPIRERERKLNAFRDTAASLQDQLLLLDDLLKVGLTALNEQIIEMMLATFIYPLLLQPLLVYYQRLPDTSGQAPALLDPFAERSFDRTTVDFNNVGRAPPHVTAPAKTAMFTLASVFHLITNRPLLRLLYTALFHPLSPDVSGETVISAEGSVTHVDKDGNKSIRVDDPVQKSDDERFTYPFGGKVEASAVIRNEVESCVFVLSPALSELLWYSGKEKHLSSSKTRPNPYRKAILQCLEVPHHMSDFRKLSVMTFDAALSLFQGSFLNETLLGSDFAGEAEMDKNSGLPRCTVEVVSAFCGSLVNGRNGPFGSWRLEFDYIASHALLVAIWRNPRALALASQIVQEKYWKAAGLLAEIPARIPTTQHLGTIMNLIFYEAGSSRRKATYEDLFHMKNTAPERFSTGIASASTFHLLCSRGYEAPPTPETLNTFNENTVMILGSSSCRAMLKLDAFSTFLKDVSKGEASVIQDVSPYGFALTSDRGLVDTKECFVEDLARSIHCYLSKEFCDALTDATDDASSEQPTPGSIVVLSGRTAMPCVCEVTADSDTGDGAKMVVEGITWQSLYLVFFGPYIVFAEPAPGSPGKGRVVTSCALSRLAVARDPNQPADPSSPARRLLMVHKWFDTIAPNLFLFDEEPQVEGYGPFNRIKLWRSKLDVWFEDDGAAAHAYHSISFQIENAKSRRGDRILDYLTQQQG